MPLDSFHPAVRSWFERTLGGPTAPQKDGWPLIRAGANTLIAAPTGSGKTLAAFLAAIDELVCDGLQGKLQDETRILYISPLKALGNDIQRNLEVPLAGIAAELEASRLPRVEIRTMVRTGDTSGKDRSRMTARPPHIVVTTPESFYILLTSEGGRRLLRNVRSVIVDEVHALVGNKRGSHLALSLARLDALAGRPVQRIGLSATQRPIDRVARFLVGRDEHAAPRPCTIVDSGHVRPRDLAVEVPRSPLEAVMSGEVWEEVYDRLAELALSHRTTLVFVNTRRGVERVTRHLGERLGKDSVASHHGSMSREQRFSAEQRLKSGELRLLVATASLELGIDIGSVELVCQIGSPRSIASLLQRVGRAGHRQGETSKGRLFPQSRDDLVECVALLDAIHRGELDAVAFPAAPLDILAQQIVAAVACEEWDEAALFDWLRTAEPYAELSRPDFDAVVQMLADGMTTRRGRRAARIHHDTIHGKLRGRRGARLVALTNGGAIPDTADYEVVLDPTGQRVGTINEDFAIESIQGDVFQLGNASWRILKVEPGRVRVEDAKGSPPTIPFWLGEAPARTAEASFAVSRLRELVDRALGPGDPGDAERATAEVCRTIPGVSEAAARQLAVYLAAGRAALSVMPTESTIVLERFFDEGGGMQLVVHSPRGSRVNRAWGLSLRKRFCQRFDFELQAAATDDAIVLSLGPTHSFPLEEVFSYLRAESVRDLLVQALLVAPMFTARWRWNASRALAVLRFRGGRRVPPRFQRMDADDLMAVVFPDQVACQENVTGPREVPDHPLVKQTVADCLVEAMDIERLESLLDQIGRADRRLVARDTPTPSPFAQEILSARPYAFLDDAPLEERRTQAVYARRFLDPRTAADLGALDLAAIERVRGEAWPEATTADELHDALSLVGLTTEVDGMKSGWGPLFDVLRDAGRATRLELPGAILWVPVERLSDVISAYGNPPGARLEPPVAMPAVHRSNPDPEVALRELVRGRLEAVGPTTARELSDVTALGGSRIEGALAALEAEGFVLRGQFTPGSEELEWCERRLLARIHRYTIGRLRSEIEPVSQADFQRFLTVWQHVLPETKVRGPEALHSVVMQLEGFEAAAFAWEGEILPARVDGYTPAWLDTLCLSGRVSWLRANRGRRASQMAGTVRATPLTLVARAHAHAFRASAAVSEDPSVLSPNAERLRTYLAERGASFFDDMPHGARLVRAEAEIALAELVARGLVTADAFAGLRALLVPSGQRVRSPLRRRNRAPNFMEAAGRWSLIGEAETTTDEGIEIVARALLRRWGVVFRRLLDREPGAPPFRDLLRVYRRLEARGDVRGGRFVQGFSGEQYALPEAVEALRAVRRKERSGALVSVSAADPLNLAGIVTPGERVPAVPSNRVLYRDGVPVARKVGGKVEILSGAHGAERWALETALVRRSVVSNAERLGRTA